MEKISDFGLTGLIRIVEEGLAREISKEVFIKCLLELKQLRAEKRAANADK